MAKLIFIVNKIPDSNDQSYDYFRRWIMLFEKTFQGVDTSLIEELTTEEELLGLSNPAIFSLQAPIIFNH
jgi:phage/plasmid-associated DNA primase